ncbi:methylated-DNA--[protein]-cysteine S-methyltransferase [Bradyrhizobium sp.]|uniref:methylated-DNA--[protein]-cysteine S-methyltransferase n=1 Tax=Bradyrhizobium sp. TaxID=376 RepID=UPI002CD4AE35|nr:methylated-DNA--[protein]-cysteine S-methyltransferase [Bradyrhizobium sp.]HLI98091.1 methylated-DNA--[protein]-cysteine S-methyltransferase [Bradyrhizobium sp.]HZR76756.1 methylated-DNA--[protein]-cysteine S-methyltransferase [Bradyrhizobium sp.]
MLGRAYSIFDTAIGRCGIAWSQSGIVGVQLPEAREIDTRRRLFQLYPEARETRPTPNVDVAIEGIVALLRGEAADLADITLDMSGIHAFDQRTYQVTRRIPRGQTVTYSEIASRMGTPSSVRPVTQAIGRNPFVVIVPCHRVLEAGSYTDKMSAHGGLISKRRLLSIEGTGSPASKTLLDVLLPVAPPRLPH